MFTFKLSIIGAIASNRNANSKLLCSTKTKYFHETGE